jgi:formylglycine-generating enzyme required for sulfatase activity
MTMVEVAAGNFMMGTSGETQFNNEKPAHEVSLTRAIYLTDREVPVEQFRRFLEDVDYPEADKPKDWKWQDTMKRYSPADDCAMNGVDWLTTVLYCNWLSVKEGRKKCYERTGAKERVKWDAKEYELDVWRCEFVGDGYRLPTEAEWEYAAKAGSSESFCFGRDDDLLPQYAWFAVNGKSRIWPGAMKLPNAFGLFDMHGNVWEWCWDWKGSYTAEAVSDPTGPAAPTANHGPARVVRGGAFFLFLTSSCRAEYRLESFPLYFDVDRGFRVCCGR